MDLPSGINSGSARLISLSTICVPSFFMPPKNHKKVIASSGLFAQGHPGVADIIADSGDEFEHLAVEDAYKFISLPLFFGTYVFLFFS